MHEFQPELFVEGAGDEATLEQNDDADLVALLDFEVEVFLPVLELAPFQGLDVEIGSFDLDGNAAKVRDCSKG